MQTASVASISCQGKAALYLKRPTSWILIAGTVSALALLIYTIVLNYIALIVLAAIVLAASVYSLYLQDKVVKLETLTQINRNMSGQIQSLNGATTAISHEREEMEAMFEEMQKKEALHEEEMEAATSELDQKSKELKATLMKVDAYAKALDQVHEEIEKSKEALVKSEAQLDRFQKENAGLKQDLEQLSIEKDRLAREKEELSSLWSRYDEENRELKEERVRLEGIIASVHKEMAAEEKEIPLLTSAEKMEHSTQALGEQLKRAESLQKRVEKLTILMQQMKLPKKVTT